MISSTFRMDFDDEIFSHEEIKAYVFYIRYDTFSVIKHVKIHNSKKSQIS